MPRSLLPIPLHLILHPCCRHSLHFQTPVAQRRALHRVKATLPKEPAKYVGTVISLTNSASPHKKLLFADAGLDPTVCSMGHNIVGAVRGLNKNRQARQILLGMLNGYRGSSVRAAQLLNVCRKSIKSNRKLQKASRHQFCLPFSGGTCFCNA